jgi:hypothetical protein
MMSENTMRVSMSPTLYAYCQAVTFERGYLREGLDMVLWAWDAHTDSVAGREHLRSMIERIIRQLAWSPERLVAWYRRQHPPLPDRTGTP